MKDKTVDASVMEWVYILPIFLENNSIIKLGINRIDIVTISILEYEYGYEMDRFYVDKKIYMDR